MTLQVLLMMDYGILVIKQRKQMHHFKKISTHTLLVVCAACILWILLLPATAQDYPENLPDSYRYIGSYQLKSKLRVENGVSQAVVISPLVYRVFSDGIEVRVYCRTAGGDSFTAYDIYRSDGVGVAKAMGEIEVVAGVQACNTEAGMFRQISVTRKNLTMVKTPPRSHRVIVTRAIAIPAPDQSTADE